MTSEKVMGCSDLSIYICNTKRTTSQLTLMDSALLLLLHLEQRCQGLSELRD